LIALRPIAGEQIVDVMLASMIHADVITRRRDGDEIKSIDISRRIAAQNALHYASFDSRARQCQIYCHD
jgi:hypothetical protein